MINYHRNSVVNHSSIIILVDTLPGVHAEPTLDHLQEFMFTLLTLECTEVSHRVLCKSHELGFGVELGTIHGVRCRTDAELVHDKLTCSGEVGIKLLHAWN